MHTIKLYTTSEAIMSIEESSLVVAATEVVHGIGASHVRQPFILIKNLHPHPDSSSTCTVVRCTLLARNRKSHVVRTYVTVRI